MVIVYAMVYGLLATFYLAIPSLKNWDYFLALRGVEYLLLAAAVANILIADFKVKLRNLWWFIPFCFIVIFGILYYRQPLRVPWSLHYYIPRLILISFIVLNIPKAIRSVNYYLLSFGVLAVGLGTADVMKIIFPEGIWQSQFELEPIIFLVSKIMLIAALFGEEIKSFIERRDRKQLEKELNEDISLLVNKAAEFQKVNLVSYQNLIEVIGEDNAMKRIESGDIVPVFEGGRTLYPLPVKKEK